MLPKENIVKNAKKQEFGLMLKNWVTKSLNGQGKNDTRGVVKAVIGMIQSVLIRSQVYNLII